MKLVRLACDRSSFHPVEFNPEGISLIVGDGSGDDGNSNGVGKTLALGLVHHCLGANSSRKLAEAVPDWVFSLDFKIGPNAHRVERNGAGDNITLDGKALGQRELCTWLEKSGVFYLDPDVPAISFRSLIKRFARYTQADCMHPIQLEREQPFEARLRALYLLGIDTSLAVSKKLLKEELTKTKQAVKDWQNDTVLKEVFRAGAKPKVRIEWLDREIARIGGDLDRFQVAEDYRAIELEAGNLTKELRRLEKETAIRQFQKESIEKSLSVQPDISREDLLSLYSGLQSIFRPEVLAHFEAVEEFHSSLAANRKARLEADKARIVAELGDLADIQRRVAKERDQKLQSIQGKRALDEYAAVARNLAGLEEEHHRLQQFITLTSQLEAKVQQIRERQIEEDRAASDYARSNPVAAVDEYFSKLCELLYPRAPAGIVLESNTGDNQVRYDLTVQIEGDDSDGINAARLICFDWTVLNKGSHHTVDFVWHDNRLFADIDPKSRATWFEYLLSTLPGSGKQYVASLNTENFAAMEEFLPKPAMEKLRHSTKLVLKGDSPANKLLGIQFGN